MNRVLRIITVMPLLFILLLASCDKEEHKKEYPLPDGQGALVIGWESEAEVKSLAVYFFDSSGITVLYNKVYDNPHEVTSEYIPMAGGDYTLLMVANADSTSLPQETTVADLTEWLKAHAGDYPGLLTASAQIEVIPGDIHRLTLELKNGTSGINLATVTLRPPCRTKRCPTILPPVLLTAKASPSAAWRKSGRQVRTTACITAYRTVLYRRTAPTLPNSP